MGDISQLEIFLEEERTRSIPRLFSQGSSHPMLGNYTSLLKEKHCCCIHRTTYLGMEVLTRLCMLYV